MRRGGGGYSSYFRTRVRRHRGKGQAGWADDVPRNVKKKKRCKRGGAPVGRDFGGKNREQPGRRSPGKRDLVIYVGRATPGRSGSGRREGA